VPKVAPDVPEEPTTPDVPPPPLPPLMRLSPSPPRNDVLIILLFYFQLNFLNKLP
jgi:hypothetical protein